MSERSDAEEALDDALTALHTVSLRVEGHHGHGHGSGREHLETILRKVPLEMMEKVRRRSERAGGGGADF